MPTFSPLYCMFNSSALFTQTIEQGSYINRYDPTNLFLYLQFPDTG